MYLFIQSLASLVNRNRWANVIFIVLTFIFGLASLYTLRYGLNPQAFYHSLILFSLGLICRKIQKLKPKGERENLLDEWLGTLSAHGVILAYYYLLCVHYVRLEAKAYLTASVILLMTLTYQKLSKYYAMGFDFKTGNTFYYRLKFLKGRAEKAYYRYLSLTSYEFLLAVGAVFYGFGRPWVLFVLLISKILLDTFFVFYSEMIYHNSITKIISGTALVFGLIIIGIMVVKLSFDKLLHLLFQISALQWLLLILILLLVSVCDVLAWKACFPTKCTVNFWTLYKTQIVSTAFNQITPTGNLGETFKLTLLKGQIDSKSNISSVVIWNFLHHISNALIVFLGSLILVFILDIPMWLRLLSVGGAVVLLVFGLVFVLFIYKNVISKLLGLFRFFKLKEATILKIVNYAQAVETHIKSYYKSRKAAFFYAVFLNLLSRSLTFSLKFLSLWVLGWSLPFAVVLFIQLNDISVSYIFSFIPSRVGITEAYHTYVFQVLKYDPIVGFAVAIIGRVLMVFLVGLAILILGYHRLAKERN